MSEYRRGAGRWRQIAQDIRLFIFYLRRGHGQPFIYLAVAALVFWLYGIPAYASVYALTLCGTIALVALFVGFGLFRRRHNLLTRIGSDVRACVHFLPEPRYLLEAEYVALLRKAVAQWERLLSDASARYGERIGYYTLWAHQIKTPIAALRLLLAEAEDDGQSRAMLRELDRIERYVEMALCYLRLDSDSTDYTFAPCALETLMRGCVRRFVPQFIAKRQRVTVENTEATALTDEKWLAFVVEQLLSNAIKYTPAGGAICVGVREGPVLFVQDTGCGIPVEELPRIFEQGFTGHLGREDKRATGLGLFLCGRILKGLGHGIHCFSEPGKGTRMEIDLSRQPVKAE